MSIIAWKAHLSWNLLGSIWYFCLLIYRRFWENIEELVFLRNIEVILFSLKRKIHLIFEKIIRVLFRLLNLFIRIYIWMLFINLLDFLHVVILLNLLLNIHIFIVVLCIMNYIPHFVSRFLRWSPNLLIIRLITGVV